MTRRSVSEVARANPISAVATAVIALVAVLTATEQGFGLLDKTHVTEAELAVHSAAPHAGAVVLLQASDLRNECRWLRDKIDRLKDQIRTMESGGADVAWIAEKQTDLDRYDATYTAKECDTVNYI